MGDKTVYSSSTKVHLLWDSFVNAEANSYERGAWLDLFLAEVLLQLQDGKTPLEILSFSGSCSVGETLAGEAVVEIKRLCGSQGDVGPLRRHLLAGRGWRSIAVLHALAPHDVNCSRDLASLLVSIYSVVEGKSDEGSNPYIVSKPGVDLESLCRFRSGPGRPKTRTVSSGIEGSPPGRKVSSSSSVGSRRMTGVGEGKQQAIENSSESEPQLGVKPSTLKIRLDPMDFDYFTTVIRSGDEMDLSKRTVVSSPPGKKKSKKLTPEDLKDDRLSGVLKEKLVGREFKTLVVDLLHGLCSVDSSVAMMTLSFALENLRSLQFGSDCTGLKTRMMKLFLTSSERVLLDPDCLSAVVQKGFVPTTLCLLEDAVGKSGRQATEDQQDFIYGLNYALVNIVHSLLLQNGSPEKLGLFHPLLKEFVIGYGSRVVDRSLSLLPVTRSRRVVSWLGQLIAAVKRARGRLRHSRSCRRPRHRNCSSSSGSGRDHHHDESLGMPSLDHSLLPGSAATPPDTCTVASLFMILTRFLKEETDKELTVRTMQVMMQCGTCCCFPAGILISRLIEAIKNGDSRVRGAGLSLLEKTVYREVGALDSQSECTVCHPDRPPTTNRRWMCLEAFQDLLLSNNFRVAYTVISHLMRVIPRCGIQVQREMLFGVFHPVFVTVTKQKSEGGANSSPSESERLMLVGCLSVLVFLLGSRLRLAREFVTLQGGLEQVLILLNGENRALAVGALQSCVVARLWEEENSGRKAVLDQDIPELSLLLQHVLDSTTRFISMIKKLQGNLKEGQEDTNTEAVFRSSTEWDLYMNGLEEISVFWFGWRTLCLSCPQVRTYCSRHLSLLSYTLLTVLLQHIAKTIRIEVGDKDELSEKLIHCNQLHMKLLESLIILTMISPYSGNPGGVFDLKTRLERVVESKVGLRSVCDVLLRSSGAEPSSRIVLPKQPMPKLSSLEVTVNILAEEANSDSSLSSSADEGYDADIEVPYKKQERDELSTKGSLPPSRKVSCMTGDRRFYNITHSSLVHIMLHLVVHCHRQDLWIKDCAYSLHKLSSLLRDNPQNCVLLARSGFTKKLLLEFTSSLSNSLQQHQDLQQSILEVFGYLARYNLQAQELAIYMNFFTSEKPPLEMLLGGLLKLLKGLVLEPKYIVCFPALYSNSDVVNTTAAHKLGISLHHQHMSLGLVSCWSRSALHLPLNTELGWSMWVHGFSLAMWLRMEPSLPSAVNLSSDPVSNFYPDSGSSESGRSSALDEVNIENLLHIVSIGCEELILEFWAEPNRDLLHIRLTRSDGGNLEVLSEASLEGRLPSGSWHHLVITVHDSVHSGKVVIEVTLIIDGWCEVQVPLTFKGLLVRESRPTTLLLGDTGHSSSAGSWQLGTLFMFRRPVVGKAGALWLSALGPDVGSLAEPKVGVPRPAWQKVFNHRTLSAGINWSHLLDQGRPAKELQETLLFTFSAKSPDIMNIYPQVLSSTSGLGSGFRVVGEQRSSQLVPMSLQLVTLCQTTPQKHCTLTTAVDSLGGMTLFLFLFARVVELGGSEIEQSQALELLLKLGHSEPHLKAEVDSFTGLICRVLESDLCKPGVHMLKAILDTCCSGLVTLGLGDNEVICPGDQLLTEPYTLVRLVVGSARAWLSGQKHSTQPPTFASFLRALLALLRDDHPHREFNSAQLNRANTLDALLDFCKERLVEDGTTGLGAETSMHVVEVIRGLMTAPPRPEHIASLSQFLLLSHPDRSAFVSHSRSSMHFLLPPAPPPRKTTSKAKQIKLGLFGRFNDEDENDPGDFFAQPVDPRKLNKALANLQIKQNSKRRLNSDSESTRGEDKMCDSGIAGSYRGNTTDSDPLNLQDIDGLSSASANTYFLTAVEVENDDNDEDSGPDNSSVTSDDVKFIHTENTNPSIMNGEEGMRAGLLEVLRDEILVAPDSVALSTLPVLVHPNALLVLANHPSPHITTAVLKVAGAYWERVGNNSADCRGWLGLLSAQLRCQPSAALIEALASLLTRAHRLPLPSQLDSLQEDDINLEALSPILALLPRSVKEIPLAHNLMAFLHALYLKVPDKTGFLEQGLVESVLKTLTSLSHSHFDQISDLGLPEDTILVSDGQNLLCTVVSQELQTPGSTHLQAVTELIQKIEYTQRLEASWCGEASECYECLRQAQAVVLQTALHCLLDLIATHTLKPSILSSVMSTSSEDVESNLSSSSMNSLNLISKLSRSDLNERFKVVVRKAVEFAVYSEPTGEDSSEDELVREMWSEMLHAMVTVIERKSMSLRTTWSNVVWANRDTLRSLGTQMLLWLMLPGQSRKLRMWTVQSILNEPRSKDILVYLLPSSQSEQTFALYLSYQRRCPELSDSERKVCEELSSRVEEWVCPQALTALLNQQEERVKDAERDAALGRTTWRSAQLPALLKLVHRQEPLGREIAERAKEATRQVVAVRDKLRKALMESIRAGYGSKVQGLLAWRVLVRAMTAECGPFHFPKSYPRSWQLDPTEGPGRVRKRLRRCHLRMDNKFMKPEFTDKLTSGSSKAPLGFLVEGTEGSMSAVLIDRLHRNTKIRAMTRASIVRPAVRIPGEILIAHCAVYFIPDYNTQQVNEAEEMGSEEWEFEEIKEIHRRRYELQERALEIFLVNGKTYLLAFQSTKEREEFVLSVVDCGLGSRVASEPLTDAVELWREGHLTNWEYLAVLNTFAGRSYNDLMQYPVLPFVLADYTNQMLDLTNPSSYRDLKKPMAIQDKKNEQHYISNYNYLKSEVKDAIGPAHEPYHYSSHYSNSGTVLHFLVRLPPFTCMFLSYQDNNFDWPDRTFHSVQTTWRLTSTESTTDVKELVPEFFFLPEFLTNDEGFQFGMRQNGDSVDDVTLPPWANDPRIFVLIHRQALESDYVRENLPHWIDLVFGYKQTGKAAVDAINVFHPATYYGYEPGTDDELTVAAWHTMVRTYGQTPRGLFRGPHPMVHHTLVPQPSQPPVLSSVKGLKWGNYVGSPACPPPTIIWQHCHHTAVASLVPLITNDVFGLAPSTCLLLSYTKEPPISLAVNGGTCVLGAALVSWGHGDGVVRAKQRKDQAPFPLINPTDTVTLCASVPDCNQLWVTHASGKIIVYTYRFEGVGGGLSLEGDGVTLIGHRSEVLSVSLSRGFSIAVSTSLDGAAILWDLNTLTYIRSLPHIDFPVRVSAVSETLGEVATGGGKMVSVHTINGKLVGTLQLLAQPTALAFSTAPEGASVNVLAVALTDGSINLWSTWDLSPVRTFMAPTVSQPIVCLTYSQDSQHLYASTSGGLVVIWESSPSKSSKVPKFLNLTALL